MRDNSQMVYESYGIHLIWCSAYLDQKFSCFLLFCVPVFHSGDSFDSIDSMQVACHCFFLCKWGTNNMDVNDKAYRSAKLCSLLDTVSFCMWKAEGVTLDLKCFSIRNAEGYVFCMSWVLNFWHRLLTSQKLCSIELNAQLKVLWILIHTFKRNGVKFHTWQFRLLCM